MKGAVIPSLSGKELWQTGTIDTRSALGRGIPFKTVELEDIESKDELLDWVDANQLGRRNLTPIQASLLRGRRYNFIKRQGRGAI